MVEQTIFPFGCVLHFEWLYMVVLSAISSQRKDNFLAWVSLAKALILVPSLLGSVKVSLIIWFLHSWIDCLNVHLCHSSHHAEAAMLRPPC